MNLENQYTTISSLILQYEEGDFLLLSDLFDEVSNLKDFFLDKPVLLDLVSRMLNCIHTEMKNAEGQAFITKISTALDFIQRYIQAPDVKTQEEIFAAIQKQTLEQTKKNEPKCEDPSQGDFDSDTLLIFITEARGRLAEAQDLILYLEQHLDSQETLQHLFRIFHTIKGECGFLKLATLCELTHNIENILDQLRSGKNQASQAHIDLLLEGVDLSKEILNLIEQKQFTMFNDYSLDSYVSKLQTTIAGPSKSLGEIFVEEGKLQEADVLKILQRQKEAAFTKRFGEVAVQENFISQEDLLEVVEKQKQIQHSDSNVQKSEKIDPVIKVKASKVNFLVDMIGELLIAIGQLNHEGAEFMQVKKITRTLQNAAMDLRTDTLHILFGSVKRAVRDLSKQLNKNVRLLTVGEDLEIDRNLIEKLEAPLMHIIRNSLDHGLGDEQERLDCNKDPQGCVELKAERHGNSIVFSVRDDGRGLDRNKILSKAIERGLVRPDVAQAMPDSQVFNFIFNSGFSTKQEVSQVSGRGVGMDVVQTVVNENRGRIEIDSVFHEFTEIRLIFPLSTAIIDGMITRVCSNNFIFPIGAVIESLKIFPTMLNTVNDRVEIAIIRGESIPVIRMHEVFNIAPTSPPIIGVICETSDKRKFMFILDEVIAKREVVIKSLGSRFSNLKGISSGTVLGGGKIGLVVDIDDLVSLTEKELNA